MSCFTYFAAVTVAVVVVSLPTASCLPLSVAPEDPSLCPNSMTTKSPDFTVLINVVKRPSSVYDLADRPAIASFTTGNVKYCAKY